MTSRRHFLAASAAVGLLANRSKAARTTSSSGYPFEEFEARIAKKDFRDMTKDILPTPCMVVDLDMFKANIKHMADTAKANGINVRPHVKVHKSVDVAKHQIAHGAIGLTCATIAEAELFSGAGIKGVLWTKQPVGTNNIQRAVLLSKKDPTFMFVADDSKVVDWLEEAASAHNAKLRVVVSVYAGMTRQGIAAASLRSNSRRRSPPPSGCSLKASWPTPAPPPIPRDSKRARRSPWTFSPTCARPGIWPRKPACQ